MAFTLRAMQSMLKIAPGNFSFARAKKQNQRNTPQVASHYAKVKTHSVTFVTRDL